MTDTFLVLVTVGLGHEVYRKLYISIGGQRAEKFVKTCRKVCQFENHCSRATFNKLCSRSHVCQNKAKIICKYAKRGPSTTWMCRHEQLKIKWLQTIYNVKCTFTRPVTKGTGVEASLGKLFAPMEKYVGQIKKIHPSQITFRPHSVPSWLRTWLSRWKQVPRQNEKFNLVSANKVSVYHAWNMGRVCLGHLNF